MNGWKVKPIFQRDPIYADHAERMAKQMRETIPPQPRPKEQFASAQRILDRPESEDEAWQNRPLPTWEQAGAVPFTKDPNEMSPEEQDAFVGKRHLDPQEIEIVRRLRESGRGHTFGDAVSEGATGVSIEKRERARDSVLYSPGFSYSELSEGDKTRLGNLLKKEPQDEGGWPEPIEPAALPEPSLAGRALHWLWKRGVPVDRVIRSKLSVERADKPE